MPQTGRSYPLKPRPALLIPADPCTPGCQPVRQTGHVCPYIVLWTAGAVAAAPVAVASHDCLDLSWLPSPRCHDNRMRFMLMRAFTPHSPLSTTHNHPHPHPRPISTHRPRPRPRVNIIKCKLSFIPLHSLAAVI